MITIYVGNRSPSLTGTITLDTGAPVDLTGSSVKLQMRAEDSTALKVDSAALIVNAALGQVRYDWAAIDVDTAGDYVAWWRVTLPSGKVQDTPEFIISIQDHYAVTETTLYVEREELKNTLNLAENFADEDIEDAILAASRYIDGRCNRRFYKDAVTTNTRTFLARGWPLPIDDLVELGAGGVVVNGSAWVNNTNYLLEPLNAPADGQPWTRISSPVWPAGTVDSWDGWDPTAYSMTVTVQGRWGWPAIPEKVKAATRLYANRLLMRTRQATFAVVGAGVDGSAVRVPSYDPDVEGLIAEFKKPSVG